MPASAGNKLPPVLSVRQPWADAILSGGKDVENRPRRSHHRGPLLIHSSDGMTGTESANFIRFLDERGLGDGWQQPNPYVRRGLILGTVDMVDCVEESDSPWFMGKFGYVLANPRPFASPIAAKGALGFWRVPAELEAAVRQAMAA